MVDLGGGQDGPIEHGFSNSVFIIPGIVFVSLADFVVWVSDVCLSRFKLKVNMDLLQGVQDAIHQEGDAQNEIPFTEGQDDVSTDAKLEKLLVLMKKLNLSDANEEQLRDTLMKKAKMGLLGEFMPDALKKLDDIPEESNPYRFIYLLILISLILMILVFFGYKLYKSHADRERKREEKRRLKQQKKKK